MKKECMKYVSRLALGVFLCASMALSSCAKEVAEKPIDDVERPTTVVANDKTDSSEENTEESSEKTTQESKQETKSVIESTTKETTEQEVSDVVAFEDVGAKLIDLSDDQIDTEGVLNESEEFTGLTITQPIYVCKTSDGEDGAFSGIRIYDGDTMLSEIAVQDANVMLDMTLQSPKTKDFYFIFKAEFEKPIMDGYEILYQNQTSLWALNASTLIGDGKGNIVYLGNTNEMFSGALVDMMDPFIFEDDDMYSFATMGMRYNDYELDDEVIDRMFIIRANLEEEGSLQIVAEDPAIRLQCSEWMPPELAVSGVGSMNYYDFDIEESGFVEVVRYPEVVSEEERFYLTDIMSGTFTAKSEENPDYAEDGYIMMDAGKFYSYNLNGELLIQGEMVLLNTLPAFGVYEEGGSEPTLYIESYDVGKTFKIIGQDDLTYVRTEDF